MSSWDLYYLRDIYLKVINYVGLEDGLSHMHAYTQSYLNASMFMLRKQLNSYPRSQVLTYKSFVTWGFYVVRRIQYVLQLP